jgi:hypothetical protein
MARQPAANQKPKTRKVKLVRPCFVAGERHQLKKIVDKEDPTKVTFEPKTITCSVADARILVNARKAEFADGMDAAGNKVSAG